MKRCFKCQHVKPLDEFYRHSEMADGHLGKCKECTKRDVSESYRSNREARAEYERKRCKDPARKAKTKVYQQRNRKVSPEKSRARKAVRRAVDSGKLTKLPCETCGSTRVEAHHDDYSKPLDVRWLCFKHHREEAHGQTVVAC